MLYTELTKKAIRICFNAHCTENDKGETPYVFHPFHLAEQMETEEETCAALLHDVVEDTNMGFADLEAEGFPKSVVDALRLLTHDEKTDYMDYVKALSGNRIAARVKLADLRHNSTAGRLPFIGDNERKRMGKYLEAQAILTGGEYNLEEMTLSLRYRIPLSDRLDIRERRYGLNTGEVRSAHSCPGTGRTGPQIYPGISVRRTGKGLSGALSPYGRSGAARVFNCICLIVHSKQHGRPVEYGAVSNTWRVSRFS